MDFALFVLLNGILLLRPEELIDGIAGLRLYLLVIVCCTFSALPRLTAILSPAELRYRPVTVCVFGVLAAFVLSCLTRGRTDTITNQGGELAKVVLYYLLMLAILNTPERVRAFAGWVAAFATVTVGLALADFLGYIDVPAIEHVYQRYYDPESKQEVRVARLCSNGVFSDPNDLCLLLTVGGAAAVYLSLTSRSVLFKLAWLAPLVPFVYALVLTKSRGGMLAVLMAVAAALYAKFGSRRGGLMTVLAVPVILAAVGGRSADISTSDTAWERLNLWAEGLRLMYISGPVTMLFGLGPGMYQDEFGHVAHNSYIHGYVEIGLLGGSPFLLAVLTPVLLVARPPRPEHGAIDPDWVPAARVWMLATVAGFAMGLYSLSRNYVLPTYLVLGMAEAYYTLAVPNIPPNHQVDGRWFKRAAMIGVAGWFAMKFATQFLMTSGLL